MFSVGSCGPSHWCCRIAVSWMAGPILYYHTMAVIVTILSLKFLPSLKPHVNAAKASVKKTLSRDDTKIYNPHRAL
jgi:hypothetical protein